MLKNLNALVDDCVELASNSHSIRSAIVAICEREQFSNTAEFVEFHSAAMATWQRLWEEQSAASYQRLLDTGWRPARARRVTF